MFHYNFFDLFGWIFLSSIWLVDKLGRTVHLLRRLKGIRRSLFRLACVIQFLSHTIVQAVADVVLLLLPALEVFLADRRHCRAIISLATDQLTLTLHLV